MNKHIYAKHKPVSKRVNIDLHRWFITLAKSAGCYKLLEHFFNTCIFLVAWIIDLTNVNSATYGLLFSVWFTIYTNQNALFYPLHPLTEIRSFRITWNVPLKSLHPPHENSLSSSYVIRQGLNIFVADSFPLKSTEFIKGGPQYNDYIQALDKVHLQHEISPLARILLVFCTLFIFV